MVVGGGAVPSLKNLDASWVRVWSPLRGQHLAQGLAPSREKECGLNERQGMLVVAWGAEWASEQKQSRTRGSSSPRHVL